MAGAESGKELEEERRLAYVALSRAKQRLVLTHVARTAAGEPALPSRFPERGADGARQPADGVRLRSDLSSGSFYSRI